MEKNLTLSHAGMIIVNAVSNVADVVKTPVEKLRRYYSDVLGRKLSMRQTWLLINAQVSFLLSAFPVDGPLLLRIVYCAWFLHALLMCKRAL